MISKFILELDYANVIRKTLEEGEDFSPLGHMIGNLQDFFRSSTNSKINFVSRKFNIPCLDDLPIFM